MRAVIGLLPRVGPHVLLQLRGMPKAFGTLDTYVCKVFTVHSEQVAVEQALFGCLIVTVLAVMQFGLPVFDDELV